MAAKQSPQQTNDEIKKLEKQIEDNKYWIRRYKESKADNQQRQRESEERKSELERQLRQQDDRGTRRRIQEKEGEIKTWKEIVEAYEKEIKDNEKQLQELEQRKDEVSKKEKSRRLLDEALRAGYVKVRIILCLLLGMSGVGKSCLKSLLLGKPPPLERNSTPCAEKPTRAHIRSVAGIKVKTAEGTWKEISEDDLFALLAQAVYACEKITNKPVSLEAIQRLEELLIVEEPTTDNLPSSQPEGEPHDDQIPEDQSKASQTAIDTVIEKLVAQIARIRGETLEVDDGNTEDTDAIFGSDWVYFTDSGGQPQFHELLPLFIHSTSATLFVVRLSESLDSFPLVEYYKDDKPVCPPLRSNLSTIDTLKCLVRSMQSRPTGAKMPKIIVVGTHKDLMDKCTEKLEEKNEKLLELLGEYSNSLVFYREDLKQLIFPVDTAHPQEEEKKIAQVIRHHVEHTVVEEVDVPIWWYILELLLRQLAKQLGREVLSRMECLEIALALGFRADAFDAALSFFHDINIVHYYPDVLPDVVFINSQVPLDKLTEIVDFSFALRKSLHGQASCTPQSLEGKWLRFRDQGIISVEFLERFQKHYVERLFTSQSFLTLLNKLLVAAPLSIMPDQGASLESKQTSEYFMPALLEMLPQADLEQYRVFSSAAAPLLIRFPEGWPRAGVFCCLVVHLIKICKWNILHPNSVKPILVARNCIKFRVASCFVTLIDSFSYIEVHLKATPKNCRKFCPSIREAIINGIEAACTELQYNNDCPHLAIFCPHTSDEETPSPAKKTKLQLHVALLEENESWVCSKSELLGEIDEKHSLWLTHSSSSKAGHSLSVSNVSLAIENLMDWHRLGLLLGMKKARLDEIRLDFDKHGQSRQRTEMIDQWLRSDTYASWDRLCTALENMDERTMASQIRSKYCV